jgi:hypothetical protein
LAEVQQPELTLAGKAVLASILAPKDVELPKALLAGIPAVKVELLKAQFRAKPTVFPLAMCAFPGGLCGAVRRGGTVAVLPRYVTSPNWDREDRKRRWKAGTRRERSASS